MLVAALDWSRMPLFQINVIHVKVRSALRCLVRMGVVAKSPEVDPVEEEDEDDAGSELRQNQLLEPFKVRGSSTSSSTDNFLQDGVSSLSWVNANQGAADDDDDDDPEIKFRRIDVSIILPVETRVYPWIHYFGAKGSIEPHWVPSTRSS